MENSYSRYFTISYSSNVTVMKKKLIIYKTYLSTTKFRQGILVSLLSVLIVMIMSNVYWHNWYQLAKFLPAIPYKVFEKNEYWRPLSSIFVHSDMKHLLTNAYMLFFLSYLNYSYYGLVLYPFLALIFSFLVNIIVLMTYPPNISLLGASGFIYLLGGCWFILYLLIEHQYSLSHRIFRVIAVSLIIFFPTTLVANVSYRSHAISFAFGLLTGWLFYIINARKIIKSEKSKIVDEDEFY